MLGTLVKAVFGTKNARELKKMRPQVDRINSLEASLKNLSDADLRAKTAEFKQRCERGESLDSLLPEAFAVCREGGKRALGMRHYDVQLIGGMVLHSGRIAEMKTGEGKTLVATLALYLNALSGKGCHLVTVNDYLAKRDAEWMGKLYGFLGLSTGVIIHGGTDREKQQMYRCDITYGTNSEFGFDYLRDNMKESIERYVQRSLNFAIVDEVDSILIDEARTPLIISGPAEDSSELYHRVNGVVPQLKKDVDYTVDEKAHQALLTDAGVEKIEKLLGIGNLYEPENLELLHHVTQSLRAHTLYKRDVNYLIEEGKVVIIDEFTGRKMHGRRWSDGLHQAVEAKEGVEIEEETQTLATISYQNYFRMYGKLGGMTGTADTEAEEFNKIYKLDVVLIPTNRPVKRIDYSDVVYKNEKGKFRFVMEEIEDCHKRGQPVLVGTISVEKSEVLSQLLKKKGVPHSVLNAKQHAREAEVVAQAGRKGAVTISTNMAGRGTDILLGGNPEFLAKQELRNSGVEEIDEASEAYRALLEKYKVQTLAEREEVRAAGGLHILGTERHESRRIDNQLRGRSGRQGDPGSSRFYMSLEDDLLRIFGADRITGLMERLGMEEDVPIESGLVNRAIENAQKRVEGHNFDIRKNLLEYDDVMNQQRKSIYALRRQILEGRYVPELTDEQKKAGAPPPEPPKQSGELTIEALGDKLRPRIAEITDTIAFPKPPPPPAMDSTLPQAMVAPTWEPPSAPVRAEALKHELYRNFGAVVELDRIIDDRGAILALAAREVAASLIQQRERVLDLGDEIIIGILDQFCPEHRHVEDWDLEGLGEAFKEVFAYLPDTKDCELSRDGVSGHLWKQIYDLIGAREVELGEIAFLYFARHFWLDEIDNQWIDHLKSMDHLRDGIGLRGYGQKDPKQEYKKEGFNMFTDMLTRISANVAEKLFRVQIVRQNEAEQAEARRRAHAQAQAQAAARAEAAAQKAADQALGPSASTTLGEAPLPEFRHKQRRMVEVAGGQVVGSSAPAGGAPPAQLRDADGKAVPVKRDAPKVGRNDPCPCGSGKKYKKCHGQGAERNA